MAAFADIWPTPVVVEREREAVVEWVRRQRKKPTVWRVKFGFPKICVFALYQGVGILKICYSLNPTMVRAILIIGSSRLRVVHRTKILGQIERIVAKQTISIPKSNDLSLHPRILQRSMKALQTYSRLSSQDWIEKKDS